MKAYILAALLGLALATTTHQSSADEDEKFLKD